MPLPAILGAAASAAGRLASGAGRAIATEGRAAASAAGRASSGGGGGNHLDKIGNIAGQFGQLAYAAQQAEQAVVGVVKAMTKFALSPLAIPIELGTAALNHFVSSVAAIGGAVAPFVKLASPVHVQLFQLAVDDLTASIGRFLIPVMEYGTKLVRRFADVTFALSGPLQRLMEAFFKPFVKLLDSSAFDKAIDFLADFIDLLAIFAEHIGTLITGFAKAIGLLDGGPSKFKDTSVGAAVRPAQITSVEEFGRKAQQAAFSLGTAATPADKTADNTKRLVELFEQFPTAVALAVGKAIGADKVGKIVLDGTRRASELAGGVGDAAPVLFGVAGLIKAHTTWLD